MADRSHRPVDTSELFFDLVFVFAITEVSAVLHTQGNGVGVLRAIILWATMYWLWSVTTHLASGQDMTRTSNRFVVFGVTLAALIMAIALPDAFGERALVFALAYWVGRLLPVFAWLRGSLATYAHDLVGVVISSPLLVLGAVLEPSTRIWLWSVAALIEFVSPFLFRSRLQTLRFDIEHIVERFGLLVLIALGETVVALGEPLLEAHGLDAAQITVFVSAFVLVVALWWMYFHHSDSLILRRVETAPSALVAMITSVTYLHLLIIAGIIATAAGIHDALAHPHENLHVLPVVLLACGLIFPFIGFIATRWQTFRKIYVSRLVGLVIALILIPVATQVPAIYSMLGYAVLGVVIAVWETVLPRSAGVPMPEDFVAEPSAAQ